jgi:prephenate dehydratase
MRLGYLGPEGTFTEEAALPAASAAGAELIPFGTVGDTVAAVVDEAVDAALVPIENSLGGSVTATIDALTAEPRLRMVGEEVLAVRQCLIARASIPLEAIEVVLSHPQALAQSARFLRERLPGARLVTTASTAEAVRALGGQPTGTAAIAGAAAARRHGGVVLAEGIEDEAGNATRFAWLAREGARPFPPPAPGAAFRTSVLFSGAGDASPGWLVACLAELSTRGVNLVKIESRPARSRLGHYLFLADCEGGADEPAVAAAVEALRAHTDQVRVLGSYAAAPTASVF